MTTKAIIKLLPFDKEFQDFLLTNYDGFSPDQRFVIEQMLWDGYCAIYKIKLEENMGRALIKARMNQEKLNGEFYRKIHDQTIKEIQTKYHSEKTVNELEQVRSRLQAAIAQKPN